MTDLQYFTLALASLHQGGWYTWKTHDDDGNKIPNNQRMTYANIVVTKDGVSKPTEAEINTKIQEIKDEETAAANKKISGKAKLKAGEALTDAEIEALFG
tara:strand:- start:68 stop:367 length:300 start_codon:yes stop_codon:yes gene_type:complete